MDNSVFKNKSAKRIGIDMKAARLSENFQFYADDSDISIGYMQFKVKYGIYKGQVHVMKINFVYGTSRNMHYYPFSPPRLTFLTPILHPNIGPYPSGIVCLDILNSPGMWNPASNLESAWIYITALLNDPNPDSPQNPDAGRVYRDIGNDEKKYKKRCKDYYNANIGGCSKIFEMFSEEDIEDS